VEPVANAGPRTTNLAEGWHNGLNTTLGMSHPSVRTVLDWLLQRYQMETQRRCMQLSAGRPLNQPRAVSVDKDVVEAEMKYSLETGHISVICFPNSVPWIAFCCRQ